MAKGNDLSKLYELRNKFTVIALTGRTGSGCTTVARLLEKGFDTTDYESIEDLANNTNKKYAIIYKYAKENFKPFILIPYIKVLTFTLLKKDYESLIEFLDSTKFPESISKHISTIDVQEQTIDDDYKFEANSLQNNIQLKAEFDELINEVKNIDFEDISRSGSTEKLYKIFFGNKFNKLYEDINGILRKTPSKHNYFFQLVSNNLRKSGDPYNIEINDANYIFSIAEYLNSIIKSIRNNNRNNGHATKVVIDSIRNPFEVMFFKQRYSAFYLIAVNKKEELREKCLETIYNKDYSRIRPLLAIEYDGGKGKHFYAQYVRDCLEKADIHISFNSKEEVLEFNKKERGKKSPAFTWEMQVLKYISLIDHPGLVTPSPEERSMQMAYTAKYNSGCISRQVGAAITDENFSIKAIGWNNTPEGHVPCLLRNADKLVEYLKNKTESDELKSFSPFEKSDSKIKEILLENFDSQKNGNAVKLKGRNISFCFKSLHNACYDGKNQVHTRSLHAEESAFLQISKYGGVGVKGGQLFTTASPCELCSKKAYQLGIRTIYYIDPYPGISEKQILTAGTNQPEIVLFNGAIGNAYHWLYEPLMPYKDELSLLLDLNIKDLATIQKEEIAKLKIENEQLVAENKRLKHE